MKINKLEKTVETTIKDRGLISPGDAVVLGLSGGPDSMSLFSALISLARRMKFTVHPVHVNHKFRPGAAERDQAFVEEICKSQDSSLCDPCRTFVVDCTALAAETGMTSEEAGREARYSAFHQTALEVAEARGLEVGQVKIAVAQNANDQAETLLFRILRGTGTDGLAGIAYERDETRGGVSIKVIRPLLDVMRTDIEAYCQEKGLEPVIDHTNKEAIYARNKIRLELLPYLEKEYNENIKGGLVRLARIAAADKDYLWQQAEAAYYETLLSEKAEEVTLDREGLAALHDSIRHRVIFKAFGVVGLDQDISEERLAGADAIIKVKQGMKKVEFPHGHTIVVQKGKVYIK